MKLKVCGLNNPENIKEILKLKPEFIGFIFYKESKRFIADNLSETFIKKIPRTIKKVGVFVDESFENIIEIYNRYNLDFVQLHGNEDSILCARLFLKGIPLIVAFQIDSGFDFRILDSYSPFCSYFLFDTKASLPGGNGIKFNWNLLNNYDLIVPFFLSGGIAPTDIELIAQLNHEMLYAVDINSKFEVKPGVKDVEIIKSFRNNLKSVNQLDYENSNR
jgi:phosphoribosylanthranilate isomerase